MMKKHFPVGTFVATPLRVLAILQLCLVFTYIGWVGGYPFLGEIYEFKVARTKYEAVIGDPYFNSLRLGKREAILGGYEEIQNKTQEPFIDKIGKSLRILLRELPIYTQIWILLSIVLPLFILLRVEGAVPCVWLLPILVGIGFFGSLGRPLEYTEEEKLFPTEAELVDLYIGRPLEGGLLEQKEQLQGAWEKYLLDRWGTSLAEGQFLFNVARVEAIQRDGFENRNRGGAGLWTIALLWNICWAGGVTYSRPRP